MNESQSLGQIYNDQAAEYIKFADDSYTWNYLEKPGFDRYISHYYNEKTRVLDVGCGTGRVINHLISRGVAPENIVGFDVSNKLLKTAQRENPQVKFFQSTLDQFGVRSGVFDLVTCNMVLHHVDNTSLGQGLDLIYNALTPEGEFFFIDTDPDHSAESRDPANKNKWLTQRTPWGTDVPVFNRDIYELLLDILPEHGFIQLNGWTLPVIPDGRNNTEKFEKYKNKPSRIAARFGKMSEEQKSFYLENMDKQIPSLTDIY